MPARKRTKDLAQRCAAQHFGPWMCEPQWFSQAVAAVKAGTFTPTQKDAATASPEDDGVVGDWSGDTYKVRYYIEGRIARVPFFGQVTKGDSSFGGASSVWTRQSVRMAANDPSVAAILLHIDSPGGTVSGTGDLADDVAMVNAVKPVYAYCEDLCASAAYWIASQATRVFANPTAQVGSIGTMTYVEDTSGAYEKAGIKVTLIATGKFKGQWIDGNPVSEDYIKEIQTEVNDLNEHFLAGVMSGRKMSRQQLETIADGRVFIAEKAQQIGLIDMVSSLDDAMAAISKELPMNAEAFKAYAASNPDAAEVKELKQSAQVAGHKAGRAEGSAEERARCVGILDAHGLKEHAATASVQAGHDPETAKLVASTASKARQDAEAATAAQVAAAKAQADAHATALAEKDKEIARLKFEQEGRAPIGTIGAKKEEKSADAADLEKIEDPKERAKAEWAADINGCKKGFVSEAVYVGFRAAELRNGVTILKASATA